MTIIQQGIKLIDSITFEVIDSGKREGKMKQQLMQIQKEKQSFEWDNITPEDNVSVLTTEFSDSGEIIKQEWK